MKAVLIANGKIENYDEIRRYIDEDDVIICADGGYAHAKKLGLTPDIVIGDMDSLGDEKPEEERIEYPTRKDFTDSELVLDYAIKKGYKKILMLGFIGTRVDHTFTNISMIFKYPSIDMTILDEHNEIRILREENEINGKEGDIISIIPIGEELEGVTTDGLSYPLDNETLQFGYSRGVSNVMTGDSCHVTVKSGKGIIIKSRD